MAFGRFGGIRSRLKRSAFSSIVSSLYVFFFYDCVS